ncbi:S-layer homology domain-containing protein [Lysinibacillus telephonicus]|uniref:S-layer homology domain-containing protein n=1 Tax=Lysinibacillus telephonicus TaxID=1714840 RepID=A0A3S0QRN8_9BACI|nr:S-layer homology domain-containing protein [Lysinibacillus telephonicus]RTQ89818.1 S-layer homology domain-containing protein [Lysinibacillus telephonicus]
MKTKKSGKNLFTAAAALTVIASTVTPGVASAAQFSDIQGTSLEGITTELVDMGIISGYPDGTFKPNKDLTRSDVVKLIGKYLIVNGYKIPSDYKTKMRFTDLTSNSNDELLQYAALVKDEGIFNGDNGKLNPSDKITRENMAVVLVNVLSTIHQFDYTTYVDNQSFKNEVVDLYKAKESARPAINVLDYYDITKVELFNPKKIVTRVQFAQFLYNLTKIKEPNLSVTQVDVISNNQLLVTLSDQSTHYVTLSNPLTENVQETVEFEIDGIQYKAVVEYEKEENEEPTTNPDNGSTDDDTKISDYKVESDALLFAVTSDGKFIESDDANIQVFGLIGDNEVELPSSAYNITTDSKYLTIEGNRVTANPEAIDADGILENETDKYEAEIRITINETGETITHSITISRENVKASGKFELIDKNSLSEKLLKDIEIDISENDLQLTTSDLFSEILEEGFFEIEDQYGNEPLSINASTGEVIFFDGSSDYIRPIISEVNSSNDDVVISSNGTSSTTIKLGENGLTEGDSFTLTLTIDDASQSIRVYIR